MCSVKPFISSRSCCHQPRAVHVLPACLLPLTPKHIIRAMASSEACKYQDKAPFNFGPTTGQATGAMALSLGAAQMRKPWCAAQLGLVLGSKVQEWVDFVKQAGVESVVSMLSPSELQTYAEPLPAAMEAAFGAANYTNIDAKAPGASAEILAAVKAARAAGKKVLVHCWGGGGRTGLVQAAWLVASKGLTSQQAAEAVTAYGSTHGLSRRVDVEALQKFLDSAGVSSST